jgi:glucokinase
MTRSGQDGLGLVADVGEGRDQVALGGEWAPGLPAHGAVALRGPGTGLGVGAVQLDHGRPMVFATEGGHIGIAPGNDEEMRVGRR